MENGFLGKECRPGILHKYDTANDNALRMESSFTDIQDFSSGSSKDRYQLFYSINY